MIKLNIEIKYFYKNHAETSAEAVFELLNNNKNVLFPFVWKSLCFSVISG